MGYSPEIIEFHRYTPGVPEAEEWGAIVDRFVEYMASMEKDPTKHSGGPNRLKVDLAWVICMYKADIIDQDAARKLLKGILSLQRGVKREVETRSHGFAERSLIAALDGDEDLASMVNLGRTLQEPMTRLDLRDKMIEVFDDLIVLLDTVLKVADRNIDTIMPGHTHMSQAQPITLAHYLLSVYDGLRRGVSQAELAYKDTNRNSGACGACSGITWPIDRWYMTELLGFDDLVEPTYDSEASQDHSLSILFALTNITLLISKASMDMNIWGLEEVDMLRADPAWCGVSSLMPNKCIPGSLFERARIEAVYVLGQMMQGVAFTKGEPHGDMLPMLELPKITLKAMAHALVCVGYFNGMLKNVRPQRKTMLEYVREGYSCTSEIVTHMVREMGYGPRRAHRIVATFVRMARERGLKAYEATGDLLDEAARFADEEPPEIDTPMLRRLLDPEEFIKSHNNTGGTAPEEAKRMLSARGAELDEVRERQQQRKARLQSADELLQQEVDIIIKE
jgi:argininosuccinate lyase